MEGDRLLLATSVDDVYGAADTRLLDSSEEREGRLSENEGSESEINAGSSSSSSLSSPSLVLRPGLKTKAPFKCSWRERRRRRRHREFDNV